MARSLSIAVLALAASVVAAQDATTYESLAQRHARERAAVAHVKSRTLAHAELEGLLARHEAEMTRYAASAPASSRTLAVASASRCRLERARLVLERDPSEIAGLLAADPDEAAFALLVEHACCESQAKLVSVVDARVKAKKVALRGPGAVVLEGADARLLGVRWGRVELVVDRGGSVRGVDLVGDERQNLLNQLVEVPK